jgi:hypothetical protein
MALGYTAKELAPFHYFSHWLAARARKGSAKRIIYT